MDINFNCHHCKQSIGVDRSAVGQTIDCPSCKQSIQVPAIEIYSKPRKQSTIGGIIMLIGVLEIIASIIIGISLGVGDGLNGSPTQGWIVAIGGIVFGIIILGLAELLNGLKKIEAMLQDRRRE